MLAFTALAAPSAAHHEAIFGPQSALFLTAERFVSLQAFSRQTGVEGDRAQETTGLLSLGFSPKPGSPLSLTAILPASAIRSLNGGGNVTGIEDFVLGARWIEPFNGLNAKWGKPGNFLLALGAVEMNNGSVDHKAWHGPADYMGGLLGSLERGRYSGIGYVYNRWEGTDNARNKAGDQTFTGLGLAYTPNENEETGRLASYQLGFSYEFYREDRVAGALDPATGGETALVHPTVVFAPDHHRLFFLVLSLPVAESFRTPADKDIYRVGTGMVYHW